MSNVAVYIMSGLGHVASNGIIYDLAGRLVRIQNVEVRVGSYSDYIRFAEEARNLPPGTKLVQVGHSLGASVAPQWARLSGRPVAGIFGFDPADNLSANLSQYGLTSVPKNVSVANGIYVPGGGLGGGQYVAESPTHTHVENTPIEAGHTKAEEGVEDHLMIDEFVKRLAEA